MKLEKPFKPMKSVTVDDYTAIQFPVWVSPKYDGIRSVVRKAKLLSNNLLPIPNRHTQKLFGQAVLNGLDGELIVGQPCGEGVFNRTTSGVMSVDGTPDVAYYVFDFLAPKNNVPFQERVDTLHKFMRTIKVETLCPVRLVQQTAIADVRALERYVAEKLAQGYEGVMLRSPHGLYKHGRSTLTEQYLMRIKPYVDSEAVVLGCEEGVTNTNEQGNIKGRRRSLKAGLVPSGTLGNLLVRDIHSGVEFALGTGTMKQAEARLEWGNRAGLVGRIAKYKYQRYGTVDKPRQPILLGWRHPADL